MNFRPFKISVRAIWVYSCEMLDEGRGGGSGGPGIDAPESGSQLQPIRTAGAQKGNKSGGQSGAWKWRMIERSVAETKDAGWTQWLTDHQKSSCFGRWLGKGRGIRCHWETSQLVGSCSVSKIWQGWSRSRRLYGKGPWRRGEWRSQRVAEGRRAGDRGWLGKEGGGCKNQAEVRHGIEYLFFEWNCADAFLGALFR